VNWTCLGEHDISRPLIRLMFEDDTMTAHPKKKLVFIDHSFHKATRSSEFFLEILRRDYEVTVYFDEVWRGGAAVDPNVVNGGNFDVVLLWQVLPLARNIVRLSCKNVVWAPMYDDAWNLSSLGWRVLLQLGLKVVCFSNAVHEIAQRVGIDSVRMQYFPEASEQVVGYSKPSVFLWQRVSEISWPLVRQILAGNDIEKIVLKDDPDPGYSFDEPDPEDLEKFNIEIVRDLRVSAGGSYEDYVRLLSSCNVFIAPRLREGIGISFLEAMARGMCVVAPDAPTMNEYIVSGENGFLFDPTRAVPIDLTNHIECGRRARARMVEGHLKWLDSVSLMLDFLAMPASTGRYRWTTPSMLFWDLARCYILAKNHRLQSRRR